MELDSSTQSGTKQDANEKQKYECTEGQGCQTVLDHCKDQGYVAVGRCDTRCHLKYKVEGEHLVGPW